MQMPGVSPSTTTYARPSGTMMLDVFVVEKELTEVRGVLRTAGDGVAGCARCAEGWVFATLAGVGRRWAW